MKSFPNSVRGSYATPSQDGEFLNSSFSYQFYVCYWQISSNIVLSGGVGTKVTLVCKVL